MHGRELLVKGEAALLVGIEYIQAMLQVVETGKSWNEVVQERSIPQ